MDQSLEFVKKQMAEQGKAWPYDDNNEVTIVSPESAFRQMLNNTLDAAVDCSSKDTLAIGYQLTLINDEKINIEMVIADDDYENFDFFSSYGGFTNDCRPLPIQNIVTVLENMANLASCPRTKITTIEDLVGVRKIKITVGDAIVGQKGKEWRIFIPAHFELVK